MLSYIIIILNTLFSIAACIFLFVAIFNFRTNNFLEKHITYEYRIADDKSDFRKRLFRIHAYDIAACVVLFISMASRIADEFRPYSDVYTMWFAFLFDGLVCIRCFKVMLLYKK